MPDPAPVLPPPLPLDAHKGHAGRLLCIAGSAGMPGAASLVVRSAHRAGAGLVTLAVFQPEIVGCVAPLSPETTFLDVSRNQDLYAGRVPREIDEHRHDVRVVGPGLTRSGRTRELVRRLVEGDFAGPVVYDADALAVLAGVPEVLVPVRGPVVLTPHVGEANALLDREVPSDTDGRREAALELALRSGAIVVLKGRGTLVTDGERVAVCERGNPGMATGGAGDVLSGILGAYLAATIAGPGPEAGSDTGYGPFEAAVAAVHVHAHAGDLAAEALGTRGLIASDLIAHLPHAQRALEGSA